eukprot:1413267-Prymnesium_polylepis.1
MQSSNQKHAASKSGPGSRRRAHMQSGAAGSCMYHRRRTCSTGGREADGAITHTPGITRRTCGH